MKRQLLLLFLLSFGGKNIFATEIGYGAMLSVIPVFSMNNDQRLIADLFDRVSNSGGFSCEESESTLYDAPINFFKKPCDAVMVLPENMHDKKYYLVTCDGGILDRKIVEVRTTVSLAAIEKKAARESKKAAKNISPVTFMIALMMAHLEAEPVHGQTTLSADTVLKEEKKKKQHKKEFFLSHQSQKNAYSKAPNFKKHSGGSDRQHFQRAQGRYKPVAR